MITIRRRLLLLLLPALALLMLIGGVVDYRVAVATTRDAYDRALANTAFVLAANVHVEQQRLLFSAGASAGAMDGSMRYAVIGPNRELISGMQPLLLDAPAPVPTERRASYRDVQLQGQPWRIAAVIVPTAAGAVQVIVAEPEERRAHTQRVMLLGKLCEVFNCL